MVFLRFFSKVGRELQAAFWTNWNQLLPSYKVDSHTTRFIYKKKRKDVEDCIVYFFYLKSLLARDPSIIPSLFDIYKISRTAKPCLLF